MNIREVLDRLDEISRRDFLKGAGAAVAGSIIPQTAKSQIIGAGEDEAKDAATKAASHFYALSKNTNRSVAQEIANTLDKRLIQFYQYSQGKNFEQATELSLKMAHDAVATDFNTLYQQVARDKEDTSFLGTYMRNRLGNRLGVDMGGRDAQLKMAGSLERFDLSNIGKKYIKAYTDGLNLSLNQIQSSK